MKKRRGSCLAVICLVIHIVLIQIRKFYGNYISFLIKSITSILKSFAVATCISLFALFFLLYYQCEKQISYIRISLNNPGSGIPLSADLEPLDGGILFNEFKTSLSKLEHPIVMWSLLSNYKLTEWREREYRLFFRSKRSLIFRGGAVLKAPDDIDVCLVVKEPYLNQVIPEGYSNSIITTLALHRKKMLKGTTNSPHEYKVQFIFYFSTLSKELLSADSFICFSIYQ